MLKVLELFSGYGSQSLALEYLGIEHKSDISEIDQYAIEAYNQIHGDTHNWGDITKIDETKLPYYDLITYSSPCQDFSVAGLGKGGDEGSGTRSSLLWECERIIRAVKPKYLLMENVKNLVGKAHKHNFIRWLRTLEMMGYQNFYQVLNAKDYGVPQNRERVFVVSILGCQQYLFPNPIKLTKRLKDVLERDIDEKYYLSSEKVIGFLEKGNVNPSGRGMNGNVCTGDVCNTLTTNKGEGLKIFEPLKIREATKKGYAEAYNGDSVTLNQPNSQTRRGRVGKQVSNTLTTACNVGVVELRPTRIGNIYGEDKGAGYAGNVWDTNTISPTLTTMEGGNRQPMITEPKIVTYNIPQTVSVRKYEVDEQKLVAILRECKQKSGLTNNQIAEKLDLPLTMVEHWFRQDNSFAIPNADIWQELKALLGIETDEFDLSITEFEEKEGVFEKANRCYGDDGLAPTLTSTSSDEKVITNYRIRKLTPRECWRLMGVRDNDFNKLHDISNTQLYKMAGNSIVVDVLMGIFKNLLLSDEGTNGQLQLF